jgi:hypothetical protein
MEEVRARITEMPDQCKRLVRTDSAPIKSHLWRYRNIKEAV